MTLTDAQQQARTLRERLIKDMTGRRGFRRDDVDADTIVEWDTEWETLIASALREAVKDYEEVLADKRRLVRKLDVLMNGEDEAAPQASLCDLVGQFPLWKARWLREAEQRVWLKVEKQIRYRNDDPGHFDEIWEHFADWCRQQAQQGREEG